jgi:hypothetical protein
VLGDAAYTASHTKLEVVLSVTDSSALDSNTSPDSSANSGQNIEQKSYSCSLEAEATIRASHVALQRKNVAVFYEEFGFATIPLVYGTKKNPIVKWIPYQDKRPTPEEISEWFFSKDEPRNVAVVLGPVSDNLIALDVDSPAGQHVFSKALADLGWCNNLRVTLLNTFVTRSGSHRGHHYLLRISQELLDDEKDGEFYQELLFGKAKRELWRGDGDHEEIALLSKGSMAVLSPSVHPDTGGWYAWNAKPPETLRTDKEIKELFGMFGIDLSKEKAAWRKDKRKAEKRRQQLQELTDDNCQLTQFESALDEIEQEEPEQVVVLGIKVLTTEQSDAFLEWLLPIYKKGDRNKCAMGVAGILLKDGFSLDSALAFVQHVCDITQDEEVKSRLETVRHTYRKTNLDDVAGWSVFDED